MHKEQLFLAARTLQIFPIHPSIDTFHGRVSNDQLHAVLKDTEDDVPGDFLEDLTRKLRVEIISLNDEVNLFVN